jgi:hypothetical protein
MILSPSSEASIASWMEAYSVGTLTDLNAGLASMGTVGTSPPQPIANPASRKRWTRRDSRRSRKWRASVAAWRGVVAGVGQTAGSPIALGKIQSCRRNFFSHECMKPS